MRLNLTGSEVVEFAVDEGVALGRPELAWGKSGEFQPLQVLIVAGAHIVGELLVGD